MSAPGIVRLVAGPKSLSWSCINGLAPVSAAQLRISRSGATPSDGRSTTSGGVCFLRGASVRVHASPPIREARRLCPASRESESPEEPRAASDSPQLRGGSEQKRTDPFDSEDFPATITNSPEVAEIVCQRLVDSGFEIKSAESAEGRNHKMGRDDLVADIEKMSLSELAALEADVVRQVTAGPIAPQGADAIFDGDEKRMRALKREISSH